MRHHERLEARFVFQEIKRASRKSIRNEDGFVVETLRAQWVRVPQNLLDLLHHGMFFWGNPDQEIAGIPVIASPDLSREVTLTFGKGLSRTIEIRTPEEIRRNPFHD